MPAPLTDDRAGVRVGPDRILGVPKAWLRLPRASAFLWFAPCILALVYFVFFVVRFKGNMGAIDWESDFASGYTLPETIVRAGTGGHTVISTTGAYVPLWFGLLTANLPLHRQLWEIAPTLLFVGAALTVGWSVAQLEGRRAATLSVLVVLVASPLALIFFMAAVAHNTVYPATALLGAYLIWLTQGDARSRVTAVAIPLLAAVGLGTCVASDALLIVTGVIPFTTTALLAGVRRDRRARLLALTALATVAASVPVAVLTSAIMRSAGYVTLPPPTRLTPLAAIPKSARLLFEGFKDLSNSYLGSRWPGSLHAEIGTACGIVMVAALLTLIFAGVRGTARFMSSGLRRGGSDGLRQLACGVHTAYWLTSAAVVCGAFLFSSYAAETAHAAYYATVIFSVAAIVPPLVVRSRVARWLVPVGASIFFLGSLVGLAGNYLQLTQPALSHYAGRIITIAEANHARTGYAGYWDAAGLTWNSHERVIVRPLTQCTNPPGAAVCPFYLMRTPSWYVPERRHTFLLVDPNQLYVVSLPPGLGPPIASYAVGPVRLYIYSYDIASRLGPAPN